jgi:hypothetical protein
VSLDVTIQQHASYLELQVCGIYNYEEAIRKFTYVFDTCLLTGQSRVFIDITQIQQSNSATEKTMYAVSVEKKYNEYLNGGGHPLRVAYLAAKVGHYEPGRDIARIVGLPFDLFDDREKALKWLEIETT